MAIYVTGDTHGPERIGYTSCDGFISRLSMHAFPEQKDMTKDDYVVILGDFGGVWNTDRFICDETDQERYALDALDKRPFTTLFVPGNHENYDRLTGCKNEDLLDSWFYAKMPPSEKAKLRRGYPQKEWHGGKVRMIRPSVLMLERGEIFDLNGHSCFAFGGAQSHDIKDGILRPQDYKDEKEFKEAYKKYSRADKQFRVCGVSWWAQEMPLDTEMDRAKQNLKSYRAAGRTIDFVFTHDAPAADKLYLGYKNVDGLNKYLESLREDLGDCKWFYGHLHDNRHVFANSWLLYDQIIKIA